MSFATRTMDYKRNRHLAFQHPLLLGFKNGARMLSQALGLLPVPRLAITLGLSSLLALELTLLGPAVPSLTFKVVDARPGVDPDPAIAWTGNSGG